MIDIDLLLYEGAIIFEAERMLAHFAILKCAFVMVPLAEVFLEKTALVLDFFACLATVDCDKIRPF